MHYDVIAYVLIIDLLAIMSPGPDFFMVLRNSVTKSHKAGYYTALGISLGSTLVYFLGIFGIGLLVADNKYLFMGVKVAGCLYLSYLALRSIFSVATVEEPQLVYHDDGQGNINFGEYFRIGLWCNLANPKAFMFIVALSTYIIKHGNPYTDGVVVVIGSFIATIVWFFLVALIFGNVRIRKVFYRYQRVINIAFGVILLYVAAQIIFL